MKDVRLKLTENEKIAYTNNIDSKAFSIKENSIDTIIEKERENKFNSEVEEYMKELEEHNETLKQLQDSIGKDPEKLEIKPMFDHILIKPFSTNPFQKVERKGNIIVDTGGFKVNVDKNPITGKLEEQEQVILVACVMEVGPTVKYIKPGDVVFYHKRNAIPVPFFRQGFYDLAEYAILSVVNERLSERFNSIK